MMIDLLLSGDVVVDEGDSLQAALAPHTRDTRHTHVRRLHRAHLLYNKYRQTG